MVRLWLENGVCGHLRGLCLVEGDLRLLRLFRLWLLLRRWLSWLALLGRLSLLLGILVLRRVYLFRLRSFLAASLVIDLGRVSPLPTFVFALICGPAPGDHRLDKLVNFYVRRLIGLLLWFLWVRAWLCLLNLRCLCRAEDLDRLHGLLLIVARQLVPATIFAKAEPLGLLFLGLLDSQLTGLRGLILKVDLADLELDRLKPRVGVDRAERDCAYEHHWLCFSR